MRVAVAIALVLAAATTAAAQAAGDEPPPPRIPARLELGASAGLTVAFPEVGLLASIPIGPQASFEASIGWMPRVIYDVEHVLTQAQFRLPFGAARRSRRSLLLGVTRIGTRQRDADDSGFWGDDLRVVFPHAGASLQWPVSRHVDFRFDAQGLFTLDSELPLVPRVAATFVWHP